MSKLRKSVQDLSRRMRHGDCGALRALISHNVALGHHRLALRRACLLYAMGGRLEAAADIQFCEAAARHVSVAELHKIMAEARSLARVFSARAQGQNA